MASVVVQQMSDQGVEDLADYAAIEGDRDGAAVRLAAGCPTLFRNKIAVELPLSFGIGVMQP